MALKFGGFFAQYGNLDKAIDKFNADAKVFKEFEAVLKKLIELINEGKVTMKSRGKKRGDIEALLKSERKRVVQSFHTESLDVLSGYRATKYEAWADKNPNKIPEADGRLVRIIPWPGTGYLAILFLPFPLHPRSG